MSSATRLISSLDDVDLASGDVDLARDDTALAIKEDVFTPPTGERTQVSTRRNMYPAASANRMFAAQAESKGGRFPTSPKFVKILNTIQ
jgi:hypothetical protein